MEMCYDGALVMPSNYAVMNADEMTYVEGGVSVRRTWYGLNIHFSSYDINKIFNNNVYSIAGDVLSVAGVIGTALGATASLLGAALVAVKYQMKLANKINGGKGAYCRILTNSMRFNGISAITPW